MDAPLGTLCTSYELTYCLAVQKRRVPAEDLPVAGLVVRRVLGESLGPGAFSFSDLEVMWAMDFCELNRKRFLSTEFSIDKEETAKQAH